jgi:hypothetical protein
MFGDEQVGAKDDRALAFDGAMAAVFDKSSGLITVQVFSYPRSVDLSIAENFLVRERADVEAFEGAVVAEASRTDALYVT